MTGGRNNYFMQGLFLAIVILLFVCPQTYAQEKKKKKRVKSNYLMRGSWSLQFRIEKDFTLGSFEGALISAKRHLSSNTAVRFGIGLNGSFENNELYDYRENFDSSGMEIIEYNRDGNTEHLDLSFVSQLLFYTNIKSEVNFYFGVGPKIIYSRSTNEYDYDRKLEEPSIRGKYDEYNSYSRSWGFGLLGSWGVEWFATRKISFICEYGAGMEYQSRISNYQSNGSYDDRQTNRKSDRDSKLLRFYSSRVNFGLSVYFN
jgi:hypothetical protein